jgi:geranylgeranyl pyrophosphate synthase
LAGDALLAFAFELLGAMPGRNGRAGESALVLARACGSQELVGGQVLDIEAEGRRVTGRAVRDIHLRKTGALIAASLELGAIAGGASATERRRLSAAGRDLGLAFQIHDDLMNRGSTLRRLGKRAGTDDARRKATYPRAVGETRARAEAEALLTRVRARIRSLGLRAGELARLVDAVAARRH